MRENFNPVMLVVQAKLMLTHFALVANRTVSSELTVFCLLDEPAGLSVLEICGEVRNRAGVIPELKSLLCQLLERGVREGTAVRPQDVQMHDLAEEHVGPLAHQQEVPGLQLKVLRTLGLVKMLPVVLVADGQLLEGVLGAGAVVVELEEDGRAGLAEQKVRPPGVLSHLGHNRLVISPTLPDISIYPNFQQQIGLIY